jgi:hypothetical protein
MRTLKVAEPGEKLRAIAGTEVGRAGQAQAAAKPEPGALTTAGADEHQGGLLAPGGNVAKAIGSFLAGNAHLNLAACGTGDTQKMYVPAVVPLTEALIQEAGGAASPSVRMVATMAANAFADYNFQLAMLRKIEDLELNEAGQKRCDRIQRRMEKSFQQAMAAVELLRRPGPARVNVNVTEASNVNLGQQQVAVGVRGCRQRKGTASDKRFRHLEIAPLPR